MIAYKLYRGISLGWVSVIFKGVALLTSDSG